MPCPFLCPEKVSSLIDSLDEFNKDIWCEIIYENYLGGKSRMSIRDYARHKTKVYKIYDFRLLSDRSFYDSQVFEQIPTPEDVLRFALVYNVVGLTQAMALHLSPDQLETLKSYERTYPGLKVWVHESRGRWYSASYAYENPDPNLAYIQLWSSRFSSSICSLNFYDRVPTEADVVEFVTRWSI